MFISYVREHLVSQNSPQKVAMLIDNMLSNPGEQQLKSEDGNIFAKFLSSNVTALI